MENFSELPGTVIKKAVLGWLLKTEKANPKKLGGAKPRVVLPKFKGPKAGLPKQMDRQPGFLANGGADHENQ